MGRLLSGALDGCDLGVFLSIGLNILHTQNQSALDLLMGAEEPGGVAGALYPPSGSNPSFYLCKLNAGAVVVLVDGVTDITMANDFYTGYARFTTGLPPGHTNEWAAARKDHIVAALQAKGWYTGTSTFLAAGHSAGGCVAQLIADQRKPLYPLDRVAWHTFGSPRVSAIDVARIADRTPGVRWMWHSDPVPLLPLRLSDAPWIIPIVGIANLLVADQYTHWQGGWQLVPGAIGHAEEIPTSAAVSPLTNVGAWLYTVLTTVGSGHTISEYVGYLGAERALLTHPASSMPRLAPVEPTASTSIRLRNAAERQTAASIVSAEHRQNAVPVTTPPQERFRAVRVGGTWVVVLGNTVVAIGGSRRGAQSLARQMNGAFRQLQRTAVVDPAALTQELTAYLERASDPSGGFTPVMNTVFG